MEEKLTTTTVIAKDTSSAMDDIISQLGEEAVILSTNHKDGKVHMTATTDNASKTPRRLKPSQQFSKIFESKMLNDQFLTKDKPLELDSAFNDTGASTAQLSALRNEIKDIKNMLSSVVVTEPQNLNDNVASSTALKLRQSGLSPKVIKKLEKSFFGKDYETGRVSFLRSLAQTLIPFDIEHVIAKSVQKTNRLLIVDEDVSSGATGYMLDKIMVEQKCFYHLDSAPLTLSSTDHRPAYGSDGDYFSKPNIDDIVEKVYAIMSESDPSAFPTLY